jgi:hypothetical protein
MEVVSWPQIGSSYDFVSEKLFSNEIVQLSVAGLLFYSAKFLAFRLAILAAFFSLGVLEGAVLSDFCLPFFSLDMDLIYDII